MGYNKLIKKKLNAMLVKINDNLINPPKNLDLKNAQRNINQVLGSDSILDEGVEVIDSHNSYYQELKNIVNTVSDGSDVACFDNYWNKPSDDVELNYNYQRFYLFNEVFTELKTPDKIKIDLILSWINGTKNINFAWTGFNCAIRLINWIKILKSIDHENIGDQTWNEIQSSIYQQHKFNKSNIEHHIPGNHVLLQYYSQWLISIIFPDWIKKSEEEKTLQKLVSEIEKEYLNSGLHFELSSHYHLQITLVGMYLISHLEKLGHKVPNELSVIMSKAVALIDDFLIGDYYPSIGDGCYNFFHESKYEDLQNLFYLKKELQIETEKIREVTSYDDIYIVLRRKKFHVIFDVGEIGLKQNSGHGHADTLNFLLGYKNIPIFIDPGTRRYSNTQIDLTLKRSNSHNTVSVDGYDQAKLWGFFRWAYMPEVSKPKYETVSDDKYLLEGKFIGFPDLDGLQHFRRLTVSESEVIIEDNLEGKIQKFVEINFILHPEIKVYENPTGLILESTRNKFTLQNLSNNNLNYEIKEQSVYEGYDFQTKSNKIVFKCKTGPIKSFDSKIQLKVIK